VTKQQLRLALKTLASEIESEVKYERSTTITLSVSLPERWRARLIELSEDELLWT